MAEEPIDAIRETNRNQLFLNRRRLKAEEVDVRRSLANSRLNASNVTAIVNKLKTKVPISASELKSLQNAIIDDPKNIEMVLNTHGALRGLVRELSGYNVSKQIASCGCLCNLALADSKACCTVAKAAGVYLVAALDSMTTQLAVTCAWTLGNLAGSGSRACDVIMAQGALGKLCDVTSGEARDAATYALAHLARHLKDELKSEHLHKLVHFISQSELAAEVSHLLYIVSCHREFAPGALPDLYLNKIVDKFTTSMEQHLNICTNTCSSENGEKCCDVVYLIRILANMNDYNVYIRLLDYFLSDQFVKCNIRRMLRADGDKSLWWLLGNMLNCCGCDEVFKRLLFEE